MFKKNNCDFIIFGSLGDLASRKLFPALYHLDNAGLLHENTRIIGVARHELDNDTFKDKVKQCLEKFVKKGLEDKTLERFLHRLSYCLINLDIEQEYLSLKRLIKPSENIPVYYFSVSPALFEPICKGLGFCNLNTDNSRVVLEKPIGQDLISSKDINDMVARFFREDQIYRIDHYLGKETVLNLIALRFANSIFTSNWDHNTIDHVQITVAEEVGIEGRWSYFDRSGQLRDMVQNHLMQILTLIAMEPPITLDAESLRLEKLKVLKALRPITVKNANEQVVRAQYTQGFIKGQKVPGYLEGEGANEQSKTETFVAIRVDIDNWRWADVPFYLRTGKAMSQKRSEVVIIFKRLPHNIFSEAYGNLSPNKLIIKLEPHEGIEIEVLNKVPGLGKGLKLQRTLLDLSFSKAFKGEDIPDAYERLILEILNGNQALFVHREEVELSWKWIDSIQEAWGKGTCPLRSYPAGSNGPSASVALLARDGRDWEE